MNQINIDCFDISKLFEFANIHVLLQNLTPSF